MRAHRTPSRLVFRVQSARETSRNSNLNESNISGGGSAPAQETPGGGGGGFTVLKDPAQFSSAALQLPLLSIQTHPRRPHASRGPLVEVLHKGRKSLTAMYSRRRHDKLAPQQSYPVVGIQYLSLKKVISFIFLVTAGGGQAERRRGGGGRARGARGSKK